MQHAHRAHLRLTVSGLRGTSHKSPRVAPPGLGTSAALQIPTWRGFAPCVGSPTPGAQPLRDLFSVALTQDPTRGDEWHPKQRFDTVLWFERMMIFFALPSCQNYASPQHSGLASPPGQARGQPDWPLERSTRWGSRLLRFRHFSTGSPLQLEAAKLKALQEAAHTGWADVAAGRYTDVPDTRLEDFVGQLGQQAASRVLAAN